MNGWNCGGEQMMTSTHDGSMGRTVYLPTVIENPININQDHVGKYTVRPMDPFWGMHWRPENHDCLKRLNSSSSKPSGLWVQNVIFGFRECFSASGKLMGYWWPKAKTNHAPQKRSHLKTLPRFFLGNWSSGKKIGQNGTDSSNTMVYLFWFLDLLQNLDSPFSTWAMVKRAPGCLGCIGDYTTQLYGDFNRPIQGFPKNQPV